MNSNLTSDNRYQPLLNFILINNGLMPIHGDALKKRVTLMPPQPKIFIAEPNFKEIVIKVINAWMVFEEYVVSVEAH